jgi:sec-independent protein translocase protein TatA
MGNLGFQELLLIGVVILVLFGSRKIPEFMKGLGKGIREFNDAKDNVKKELEAGMQEKEQPSKPSVNTTPSVGTTAPVDTAKSNDNLTTPADAVEKESNVMAKP